MGGSSRADPNDACRAGCSLVNLALPAPRLFSGEGAYVSHITLPSRQISQAVVARRRYVGESMRTSSGDPPAVVFRELCSMRGPTMCENGIGTVAGLVGTYSSITGLRCHLLVNRIQHFAVCDGIYDNCSIDPGGLDKRSRTMIVVGGSCGVFLSRRGRGLPLASSCLNLVSSRRGDNQIVWSS